jgi:hypothetical protein
MGFLDHLANDVEDVVGSVVDDVEKAWDTITDGLAHAASDFADFGGNGTSVCPAGGPHDGRGSAN